MPGGSLSSVDQVKLAGLRELAADFLVLAGKDRVGRRQWDPVFEGVTERRPAPRHPSCGDLGHWILARLGFRFPWLNREELWGWMVGKNVSLLCAKSAGGANELGRLPGVGGHPDAGAAPGCRSAPRRRRRPGRLGARHRPYALHSRPRAGRARCRRKALLVRVWSVGRSVRPGVREADL